MVRSEASVSTSAARSMPFMPTAEQENAVFCQECPTLPRHAVAMLSDTVGVA